MFRTICLFLLALYATTGLGQQDNPVFNFKNPALVNSSGQIQNAVLALERAQELADEDYKSERFEQAFERYMELAEYNDKFSQYRVGYMYALGKGTEKDLASAYAWTRLAAETDNKAFVKYHLELTETIPEPQIEQGKRVYSELLRDHGHIRGRQQGTKIDSKIQARLHWIKNRFQM